MLKAKVQEAEFTALDETLKAHYKKEGDAFMLTVQGADGFELADTQNLKKALQSERTQREEFQKQVKDFSTKYDGVDPEEAREAVKKLGEMKNWAPEEKLEAARKHLEKQFQDKLEADRTQLTQKYQQEKASRDSLITELNGQLEHHLVTSQAAHEFIEQGGRKQDIDLALERVRKSAVVRRLEGGNHVVRIVDNEGKERISPVAGSADPMSLKELVAELKVKHPSIFDGTGSTGAGTTRSVSGIQQGKIRSGDFEAIGSNLEAIANGEVTVE